MGDITGSRAARREARQAREAQEQQIAEQRLRESQRLSDAEDEIARRRALAGSRTAGRRSLIRTSEVGTAPAAGQRTTLG